MSADIDHFIKEALLGVTAGYISSQILGHLWMATVYTIGGCVLLLKIEDLQNQERYFRFIWDKFMESFYGIGALTQDHNIIENVVNFGRNNIYLASGIFVGFFIGIIT